MKLIKFIFHSIRSAFEFLPCFLIMYSHLEWPIKFAAALAYIYCFIAFLSLRDYILFPEFARRRTVPGYKGPSEHEKLLVKIDDLEERIRELSNIRSPRH